MKGESLFLIQVPYFEDYGPMRKAAGTYFPLGLGYIAAYATHHGYDIRLFDPNVQDLTPNDIAEAVYDRRPALVGLSFMTPQVYSARRFCQAIKAASPDTPVVLGGVHPSVAPAQTLEDIPEADFVIVGEGEEATVELLSTLAGLTGRFDRIRGLLWRDNGSIMTNAARDPIADLDRLPFPDRSIIDHSLYRAQSFLSYSPKSATIYTSRGCPGRCVFCCSGHTLRSRVRERSIPNVMAEIDDLISQYDVDYLLIKDDTFTMRKSRVKEFCRTLTGRYPDLKWHCMGRVNTVDYDLLALMQEAGLNDIFFGIESGNDEILKMANKGITRAQARQAVEACARLGIMSYGAFILGLPGETRETVRQTVDFARSLPLTMAGFSVLIPYPGTRVFEECLHMDPESPIDYSQFIASTGVHYVEDYQGLDGMRPRDLPKLVSQAQRRFYLRPTQILRMLRHSTPNMLLGYARGLFALIAKEWYLRVVRTKNEP